MSGFNADSQSAVACKGATANAKCSSRSFASWNVGGQSYEKVDMALREFDLVAVQEISRSEKVGWDEKETDSFSWFSHRDESQWRGVAVGVASDLLDCVIDKMATTHGAAWFVRLKGHKRMTIASLHCPTGVTVAQYQETVGRFRQRLRAWHPECPAIVGVDVNEVIQWTVADDDPVAFPVRGGGKVEAFLELLNSCRLRACPPEHHAQRVATHYPRDATRVGRHIDVIAARLVRTEEVRVVEAARNWINTDHALLYTYLHLPRKWVPPRHDTRPRWVVGTDSLDKVGNLKELYDLAARRTKPRKQSKYVDDDEVRDAARKAKASGDKAEWKGVHALRKRNKKKWRMDRFASILSGDWGWYRSYKQELNPRHWWGRLLENKSSSEIAAEAQAHLIDKMWDADKTDWDDELEKMIAGVEKPNDFASVLPAEVWGALEGMKAQAALGPDGVSVPLLKQLVHEQPESMCRLLQEHILRDELPVEWHDSFLALLAKVAAPTGVAQLRPIAMSCTLQKLITRIIMNRCFDGVRSSCRWASSGKGRQVADLIGAVSRFRDNCREWKMGGVLLKLDIRGAFDYIHRSSVARFLVDRLGRSPHGCELAFLLRLLRSNRLVGQAPGGAKVEVKANRGIRQGSPESAELFGLIIQQMVTEAHEHPSWRLCRGELDDMPLDGGCFQDDIILWGDSIEVLENNVAILVKFLGALGLRLAAEKTGIIAAMAYKGPRTMKVDDQVVEFLEQGASIRILGLDFCLEDSQSQQAKGLMGRVWAAWGKHAQLLRGPGNYTSKVNVIRSLLQGTWQWVAGAVHWGSDDLRAINSLQLRLYRLAFGCARYKNETWTDFNTRTCRWLRAWIYNNNVERWSTTVLRLQHQLAGHWGRQREGSFRGMAGAMLKWRDMEWWREEQQWPPPYGKRHPGRFYADNFERRLSQVFGVRWMQMTIDRDAWRQGLRLWLRKWDVPWCKGRQLELEF